MFVVLSLFPAGKVWAAGFDCTKAATKIEKMICADKMLSQLDEELSTDYTKALKAATEPEYIKQQQKEWLATERNRCVDNYCLRNVYKLQIALLRNLEYLDNKPVKNIDCLQVNTAFEHFFCGHTITTYQGNENRIFNYKYPESPSRQLAELDAEMHTIYKKALAKHFDPELLRREQRAWLKARERCVLDDNCSSPDGLYEDRIYNLRYDMEHPPRSEDERKFARLLSMGSPPGDNFVFSLGATNKGYGYGICEVLVRWVNYVTPKGDLTNESGKKALRMPGLNYPVWQELDMQQHLDLFAKIVEYKSLNMPSSPIAQKEIEAARNGLLKLWMVKEDINHLSEDKPKTLVTYSIVSANNNSLENQTDEKQILETPVIVTENLHEVDIEATRRMMGIGTFRYYREKPYFVGIGGNHTFVSNPLGSDCEITNFKPERSKK